jgi:signal transduction histidine kinase
MLPFTGPKLLKRGAGSADNFWEMPEETGMVGRTPVTNESTVVDWEHIDKSIVILATAAAAVFFVILSMAWLASGEPVFGLRSLTPAAVILVGVIMLALDWPRPLLQIAVGAIGMIFYVSASDAALSSHPLIGLLIMAIIASVLAHRHAIAVAAVAAAVLAATGWAWHPPGTSAADRAVMAFSLVVAYAMTAWMLLYLKTKSQESRLRLESLVAAKDTFLATVSHELRTPLTIVVGLAHELHDRWGDFSPAEIEELTALMARESGDMANIVDDLLVVGTANVGDISVNSGAVDLRTVVRQLVADYPTFKLESDGSDRTCVAADPVRLRQIVRNLLSNAERHGGAKVRVVLLGGRANHGVELRDDGPPLSREDSVRIFDVYHRAGRVDGRPGSVGLGLSVSRQLARLMGGDVSYRHDGVESVFSLTLPAVHAAMRRQATFDAVASSVRA